MVIGRLNLNTEITKHTERTECLTVNSVSSVVSVRSVFKSPLSNLLPCFRPQFPAIMVILDKLYAA